MKISHLLVALCVAGLSLPASTDTYVITIPKDHGLQIALAVAIEAAEAEFESQGGGLQKMPPLHSHARKPWMARDSPLEEELPIFDP